MVTEFPSGVRLGRRIHDRRTSLHLTLLDVAQRMGLCHNSVPSLWELGKRPVPAHRLDALARALETNPTWLLDGVVLVDEFLPPPILQLIPVALSTSPAQRPSEPDPEPGTQPTPEPDLEPNLLAPSEFELLWCTSSHGARDRDGNLVPARRHHHGPWPSYAGLLPKRGETRVIRVVTRTEDL